MIGKGLIVTKRRNQRHPEESRAESRRGSADITRTSERGVENHVVHKKDE